MRYDGLSAGTNRLRVGRGSIDDRCYRRIDVGAAVETSIELGNVQILFPGGDGNGCDAVADVVDQAAAALHEWIDAEQQSKAGHRDIRHCRESTGQHDKTGAGKAGSPFG